MSLNKRRALMALRPAAAVVCYYAIMLAGTFLLTRLFGALFDAWGVTSLNLSRAPGWAQWLADNYINIISAFLSGCVAVAAHFIVRNIPRERSGLGVMAGALAAGIAAVALGAALFLLSDSLRLESRLADPDWDMLTLAVVYLAAAWAEQTLARNCVFGSIAKRPVAYAVSAAVFCLMGKAWTLGAVGFANMLIASVALCAITEKFGGGAAICLRLGWSWALTCLISFPGGTARALYCLYPVSENLLTGGANGLITGLYSTVIWLLLWLIACKAPARR